MFKSFCVLLFNLKYAVRRELLQGGKINNKPAAVLIWLRVKSREKLSCLHRRRLQKTLGQLDFAELFIILNDFI